MVASTEAAIKQLPIIHKIACNSRSRAMGFIKLLYSLDPLLSCIAGSIFDGATALAGAGGSLSVISGFADVSVGGVCFLASAMMFCMRSRSSSPGYSVSFMIKAGTP